jgi:hypothetical protein
MDAIRIIEDVTSYSMFFLSNLNTFFKLSGFIIYSFHLGLEI